MIKFATIGTNFVVEWFLKGTEKCDELEHVATYSRDIEKAKEFGQKYGAKLFFDSIEEMAKSDEIDAVYIASPNSEHFKQALTLIEHDKHVLIEKTIVSNVPEMKILMDKAQEHQVVLMEAVKSVYDPGFEMIREAIKKIEPVRRVSFQYCQYSSRYDKFKNGIVENAFNPKFSNGALTDIGVYCIHPLVRLFERPNAIKSSSIILPDSIDGEGTILLEYDGMLAELLYSKISDSHIPSQIQGEKGSIVIKEIPNPRYVTIYYRDGSVEELDVPYTEENMEYEAKEWARMISEGDYSTLHSKYSLMELEIMDEVRRQQGIVFPADKE